MSRNKTRDGHTSHLGSFTEEEQERLRAVLGNPVAWGQSYLYNRNGTPREFWPHQIEDLVGPEKNIIHLDGRGVGKTIALSTGALHFAFTMMGI